MSVHFIDRCSIDGRSIDSHSIDAWRGMHAQNGSYLVESMVSVLLVAVLGLGLAHATSKSLVAQRYTTTQNITVMHMREHLQTRTADSQSFSLADKDITLSETVFQQSLTVSVAGIPSDKTIPNAATGISLSVTEASLYSGDGTITLSHGVPATSL